ncbi:MAG: hypothetical protein RL291_1057 [Pseudomonadota bacterium]
MLLPDQTWGEIPIKIQTVFERRFGGAEGNRTPDLLNAIQALSQLSYAPSPSFQPRHLPRHERRADSATSGAPHAVPAGDKEPRS